MDFQCPLYSCMRLPKKLMDDEENEKEKGVKKEEI